MFVAANYQVRKEIFVRPCENRSPVPAYRRFLIGEMTMIFQLFLLLPAAKDGNQCRSTPDTAGSVSRDVGRYDSFFKAL